MKNLLQKQSVLKVKNFLKTIDPGISLIELKETARTAEDAAKSLSTDVGSIVKSLIFKSIDDSEYYLFLVSGNKYISIKKIESILKKEIVKTSAEECKKLTGFSIGGVSPVSLDKKPNIIFIDSNLKKYSKIYAAAGHPYVVFSITFEKLSKITDAIVKDFVK
tara:strand:- start:2103 stop:2591 length:489 start_codon:yes stop_codon:yes gene_type:complete